MRCFLTTTAALISCMAAPAGAQFAAAPPGPDAKSVATAVSKYIAAWNEVDPVRRRRLVAETWTEAGSYEDGHRRAAGLDAIDAMIARAQAALPGYRLRLVAALSGHGSDLRFSWAAGGTDEAPLFIAGTDVVTLASDGRFVRVIGFTDAANGASVPAPK